MLERHAPHLFRTSDGERRLEIDPGVLRAFLGVSRYKHGARSMESILLTSNLSGRRSFERSRLPADEQLELHVNGDEFRALVHDLTLAPEPLERLARAAHDVFCSGKKRDGWEYGSTRDNASKLHPLLIDCQGALKTGQLEALENRPF